MDFNKGQEVATEDFPPLPEKDDFRVCVLYLKIFHAVLEV
jgi:hypothetical protein